MAVREAIKTKVMMCLNELHPDINSYNSIMSFDMDRLIDEAGRLVALQAPISVLGEGVDAAQYAIQSFVDGSGAISLPKDFLRLLRFRMVGWHRPVVGSEVIREDSGKYPLQFNLITRGGPAKPMVAIVKGGRALEYFSLPEGCTHEVAEFRYFPYESVNDSYPTKLSDVVAWQTTAMIFDIMQEGNNAEMAINRANELLSVL